MANGDKGYMDSTIHATFSQVWNYSKFKSWGKIK